MVDVAWAAGIFDGEGHACAFSPGRHTKRLYLRLAVSNTSLALLERWAQVVDGKIRGPYRYAADTPTTKPRFSVQLNGRKAENAADMLLPFLSSEKREQIAAARRRIGGQ
jgi:hypothetical protein